jgi:hypothetical protein
VTAERVSAIHGSLPDAAVLLHTHSAHCEATFYKTTERNYNTTALNCNCYCPLTSDLTCILTFQFTLVLFLVVIRCTINLTINHHHQTRAASCSDMKSDRTSVRSWGLSSQKK